MENGLNRDVEEKVLSPRKGGRMLAVTILAIVAAIALFAVSIVFMTKASVRVGMTADETEYTNV